MAERIDMKQSWVRCIQGQCFPWKQVAEPAHANDLIPLRRRSGLHARPYTRTASSLRRSDIKYSGVPPIPLRPRTIPPVSSLPVQRNTSPRPPSLGVRCTTNNPMSPTSGKRARQMYLTDDSLTECKLSLALSSREYGPLS